MQINPFHSNIISFPFPSSLVDFLHIDSFPWFWQFSPIQRRPSARNSSRDVANHHWSPRPLITVFCRMMSACRRAKDSLHHAENVGRCDQNTQKHCADLGWGGGKLRNPPTSHGSSSFQFKEESFVRTGNEAATSQVLLKLRQC